MSEPPSPGLLQRLWVPAALIAGVAALTGIASAFGSDQLAVSLTEMLIRMTVVVGIYMFVGNSGILSFGHVGFMCIGAYAAAWLACDPDWKSLMLTGLPVVLQNNQYPFPVAIAAAGVLAAVVGLLFGTAIMRLSGIAASIATFAFLVVVNSIYGNWDSVTAGTSSVVGIPTVVGPWTAFGFAAATILAAWLFQNSAVGLMLKASRDDEVAAKSSAVNIVRVRLIAFVFSAFFVGIAGGLYAYFLGILTVDIFYLELAFITVTMLIVGGASSLTGAVAGVVAITVVTELLRGAEKGIVIGGAHVAVPQGTQEIGLGLVMALILIFRPSGLAGGREIGLPWRRRTSPEDDAFEPALPDPASPP